MGLMWIGSGGRSLTTGCGGRRSAAAEPERSANHTAGSGPRSSDYWDGHRSAWWLV